MHTHQILKNPAFGSLLDQHQIEKHFSKALVKSKAGKHRVVNQKSTQRVKIDVLSLLVKGSHTILVAFYNAGVLDFWQVNLRDIQVKNVQVIIE